MIKKIACFFIGVCLLIAIPLSIAGITKVDLGAPFMAFLRNTNRDLEHFKVAIPNIPHIPSIQQSGNGWLILKVVVNFFNGFINVCNFAINFMNIIIQFFEFIFLLIRNLITFRESLTQDNSGTLINAIA